MVSSGEVKSYDSVSKQTIASPDRDLAEFGQSMHRKNQTNSKAALGATSRSHLDHSTITHKNGNGKINNWPNELCSGKLPN